MIDTLKPLVVLAIGALIVAALGGIAGAWQAHNRAQQQIGVERAEKVCRDQKDRDAQATQIRTQSNFMKTERASDARAELEQQLTVARSAARNADERLRVAAGDFQRRLAEASREAAIAAGSTAAQLLGECSREYRSVASAADGHLADAEQCRAAWPE